MVIKINMMREIRMVAYVISIYNIYLNMVSL